MEMSVYCLLREKVQISRTAEALGDTVEGKGLAYGKHDEYMGPGAHESARHIARVMPKLNFDLVKALETLEEDDVEGLIDIIEEDPENKGLFNVVYIGASHHDLAADAGIFATEEQAQEAAEELKRSTKKFEYYDYFVAGTFTNFKKQLYTLTISTMVSGVQMIETIVFKSLDKAKKKLKEVYEESIQEVLGYADLDDYTVDLCDELESFEIYLTGYAFDDSIEASISETVFEN